ncbi:hypothetical protein OAK16_04485 [Verrucomicrobia bacterium]|nr:hypothetical protein [Verrucomicrobiota bacterium]
MKSKLFKPHLEAMKKKANQGDKKSALQLAIIYMRGDGVKLDADQAAKWGIKAFEQMTDEELDNLPNQLL